VVRLTSRQNSGFTKGLATTDAFEIDRKKPEAETAGDHRQHPIVTVTSIDRLAVDTEVIEHAIHHIVEFAERSLHIRLAGEIPDLNGLATGETMPGRQDDHHLLPKQG
jgi:hypothetical protein